jgi:hypothetical protein
LPRVLQFAHREDAIAHTIAGIDIHKKVLMVVVLDAEPPQNQPQRGRLGTTSSEVEGFLHWLQERSVQEAVMESTAQYWKPV